MAGGVRLALSRSWISTGPLREPLGTWACAIYIAIRPSKRKSCIKSTFTSRIGNTKGRSKSISCKHRDNRKALARGKIIGRGKKIRVKKIRENTLDKACEPPALNTTKMRFQLQHGTAAVSLCIAAYKGNICIAGRPWRSLLLCKYKVHGGSSCT